MITKPTVELIGQTHVCTTNMLRILERNGGIESYEQCKILQGTCHDKIVEFSGRLCYNSASSPRPGGSKAYHDHIKETGHFSVHEHANFTFYIGGVSRSLCYDGNTSVLTKDGWKNIKNVTNSDSVLTLNPETRMARWSPVLSSHSFFYDGYMYGWKTSRMSSPLMTEDHLLWAANYDLRRCRDKPLINIVDQFAEKIPINELYQKRFVVKQNIEQEACFDDDSIEIGGELYPSDKIFSLMGWVATDGCFSKHRKNAFVVMQSKKENLAIIEELFQNLFPGKWKKQSSIRHPEYFYYRVHNEAFADFLKTHIGLNKKERWFSGWVIDASPRLLKAFLDAAILGDGNTHKKNGHQVLYTPSESAAGQYQIIASKLGMPANIRVDDRIGESHSVGGVLIQTKQKCYIVSFDRTSEAALIQKRHQFRQYYTGLVYCPKTEDGIIFVKGSGQPFWCGNTHEYIRHRHLSPSQRSQRFVDESGIEVVVPPLFIWDDATEDDPDRKRVRYNNWFKSNELESTQMYNLFATFAEQVVKEKYPNASGTTKRKLIREAARCVLPNMAETELTMTGNARAWRHFLNLRGSRHADMEIRRLAVAIARVLRRETTYLFDDIGFEPIEDLPGEVEIKGIWEGSGEVRALKKRIAELEEQLEWLNECCKEPTGD